MKKNAKIIIAICTAIIIAAVVILGGIAIHDKSIVKNAKENLSVTNVTIKLQNSDVTVTVDDVLTKNDIECTALFSNNAGSIEINAAEVNEYNEQLTVSLLKPILFNKEIKFDVKISVVDTTAPEFTENIDEIKIIEPKQEAAATTNNYDTTNNTTANNSNSGSASDSSSGSTGSTSSGSEEKNASAKEVQNKINEYIRSKGITVDTSMRQNNASWNGKFSGNQKDISSGWTMNNCKEDVDYIIKNYADILSMYCYYDGNDFYILYW